MRSIIEEIPHHLLTRLDVFLAGLEFGKLQPAPAAVTRVEKHGLSQYGGRIELGIAILTPS
jgi:hypothetical protein